MTDIFRQFVWLHLSLLTIAFPIRFTVLNDFNKAAKIYGEKKTFYSSLTESGLTFLPFPSGRICCPWSACPNAWVAGTHHSLTQDNLQAFFSCHSLPLLLPLLPSLLFHHPFLLFLLTSTGPSFHTPAKLPVNTEV